MAFKKGEAPGRPKGAKNKKTLEVEEIISRMKINPLQMLCYFAEGNWKKLGYENKSKTSWTSAGIEYEEDVIGPELRVHATKEVVKYVYSQKKSVEHALQPDQKGFRIIVEDYTPVKAEEKK